MKSNTVTEILCVILGVLIGFLLTECIGETKSVRDIRSEAINAGAAEFVITDPTTGETEFQWITNRVENGGDL